MLIAMKKLQLPFPAVAFIGLFCLSIIFSSAGQTPGAYPQPEWSAPAENLGNEYWVIETSIYPSDYSIIRFYDKYNQLIYEQKLEGTRLSLNKKNIKMLNQALKKFKENGTILTQLLIKTDPKEGGTN